MHKKVALFVIVLAAIASASSVTLLQVYAQGSHSESDSTPISAVIIMTTDDQGKAIFNPMKTTIKQGEELLVLNNLTKTQTFTNGNGTGDPMDGKMFSVDITPNSFSEYLASISPGNYSFYSKNDPNLKGELTILP